MTLKILFRIAAWMLLAFIVVATLSPTGLRPHADLPVNLERAAAFAAVGLLFALAYPRQMLWAAALLVLAALCLELLQNLRPDRHGRELDALAKVAGAVIGLGMGATVSLLLRRVPRA